MKAFTGFAIGTLAVLGAVAAAGLYFKKKADKEQEYDKFDDIMESEEDFDTFFDEDDEVLDEAAEKAEDAAEKVEDIAEAAADKIDDITDALNK